MGAILVGLTIGPWWGAIGIVANIGPSWQHVHGPSGGAGRRGQGPS